MSEVTCIHLQLSGLNMNRCGWDQWHCNGPKGCNYYEPEPTKKRIVFEKKTVSLNVEFPIQALEETWVEPPSPPPLPVVPVMPVINPKTTLSPYTSKHPLYLRWAAMIGWCHHPNHQKYKDYGAKGITVCERWWVFANFVRDFEAFCPECRFKRINKKGDFTPENYVMYRK